MKQPELDRELRLLVKTEAKKNGWKWVAGMAYWTLGPLFFVLAPIAIARNGRFYCSLRFKWLELDRALWRVLDLSSNEDLPFSLHANGAFALLGQEIHTISMNGLEWLPGVLVQQVAEAAQQGGERAKEVAGQITSIHSYLEFIQREHEAFLRLDPGAITTIWTETLLVAMVAGDMATAAEIARARIAAGAHGKFSVGGKSEFERALALCET